MRDWAWISQPASRCQWTLSSVHAFFISASAEINAICQSCFTGALLNMPVVGSLSVYLRLLLSFRCRQETVLPWYNTVCSREFDYLPLKSACLIVPSLSWYWIYWCLKHQVSVRGSLTTPSFPGCLCQLQGPHEAVKCLSVADSLFHILFNYLLLQLLE